MVVLQATERKGITMALGVYTECTKKWKLDNLGEIVDSAEGYVFDSMSNQHMKTASDYLNILLFSFGKSVSTMREVICLSTFGFPDGALSLARNLYEQFVIVSFFELHYADNDFQSYVDNYFIDYNIRRNNALRYEAKHFENEEDLRILADEKKGAKTASHHKKRKQVYWWAGKGTFRDIVEEIQCSESDSVMKPFLAQLHFAYKRACETIHVSCLGNELRLGVDSNFVGIDNSPKTEGHELPLYLATCSFIMILGITCKRLGLNDKYMNKELNSLAAFYLNVGEVQ